MFVAVALFEIHIEHAQSLKEKRMVVKSLRDQIRNRFEVSVAEVAMQDLHQRARLAICFVSSDRRYAEKLLETIGEFIEQRSDEPVVGWTQELLDFDENAGL
jgi:uncharacterized protein YlxP (DUF503 family)